MRAIEPIKDIAPPASLGPVPELRWLPIASLVVDDAYQRLIGGRGRFLIQKIAREFSWLKFAPVVVSPIAGGVYAIVDGQHRATGAASIGIGEVPCLIIQADAQQQAKAFSAINGQTVKMNRQQLYHASLAAGHPDAVATDRAAREAGVVIVRSAKTAIQLKPGDTMACGTISQCVAKCGHERTVIYLRAVRASEGTHCSALLAQIIVATANVLDNRKEWRRDARLYTAFEAINLLDALEKAKAEAARRKVVRTTDLLEATLVTHLDAFFKRTVAA
ncbi:ParB N-terminal domain-containing protein [Methylocella silvestris]|uniref:Chromosome partitioning protein ParB n=1 Tax=Methylocella silvestris TaxID=199596 RepID=A0A2J7TJT2_METSI|nr:ParB N-terminal domain-containing protein [Methylocella silvestris]PNG27023.1 chromosome partitioning protein ParB [Methylocella silvestris]